MSDSRADHERTSHRRDADPGRGFEQTPGLVIVGAAALAFVICVATFALGDAGAGVAAAIVALLGFGAGLAWLTMDRRRIRQAEREWPIGHAAR